MEKKELNLDPKKTIFLIDGSSFLYRAYYGLRPLHAPDGRPIQGVYSFCRMIKKLVKMFAPEFMVLVWDSKGPTERHEMYEEYKKGRQAPPADLFDQRKLIIQFADLIGVKQIENPGIEADDIMYSIAQEQKDKGMTTVFITSDKDMSQAIDGRMVMRFDPFKDQLIDKLVFEEHFGFPVRKLPFYFALLGDASDNIPGVAGIGKKGAAELVKSFDSLEDLYARLEQVKKPRMKIALEASKDNAFLSETLFKLIYHPTGFTTQDFMYDADKWHFARPLFVELNFKTLLQELDKKKGLTPKPSDPFEKLKEYRFTTITSEDQLMQLAQELKKKKAFAIDTETTDKYPLSSGLVGLSICYEPTGAYYIPVAHDTQKKQLSWETVSSILKPIFEDATIEKYLHHAKFDKLVLWVAGITLKGIAFDSLIAARLIAREWQRISLKALSQFFFKQEMITYDEVVTAYKRKSFSEVPLDLATRYAAADALQTFRLKPVIGALLQEQGLLELYRTVEHPMIDILFEMETAGVFLDKQILEGIGAIVGAKLTTIENKIHTLIGPAYKNINLRSPKQIEKLLFEDLKLPPQKKSAKKTGYSTDHEVLKELAKLHPVPALLVEHRELSKLKNTYIDALPTYVAQKTNKLHTSYSQTVVATGRLASSNPNLQNIPADSSGFGLAIRSAFKPQEGHSFISADYSQIELRILAHLSQDPALLEAFKQNQDIHARTASRIAGVPIDQVTPAQRQVGKRINFSILYGLTPYGLSKDLNIPFSQAKEYIEAYFDQYPLVSQWMAKTIEFAKEHGYVQTVWGRKRYIGAIQERNKSLYEEACRVAINTVAQGTAADIIKIAMQNLHATFKKHNLDAKILLQIHDELLIDVPDTQLEQTKDVVKSVLEGVVDWRIPLVTTVRVGKNWKAVTK